MPVDGVQLGKHPLISRLMKGVFHLRPPQPRYAGRWDVSKVLQFLEEKGNTESLSMKDLTYKLVMLMALANDQTGLSLLSIVPYRTQHYALADTTAVPEPYSWLAAKHGKDKTFPFTD